MTESKAAPDPHSSARPETRAITAELLGHYDRPGPRYTSYPTALEFTEKFTEFEYRRQLALAAESPSDPLSLYVHLPFCERRCLFCGCHVIITPHKERALPYLDHLKREVELVSELLDGRNSFAQLHLGGGTPTYFEPEDLAGFLRHLLHHFRATSSAELAVEVDPCVTAPAHLESLADLGFNRLSMGVQDLDPEVQEAVNRGQTREATEATLAAARRTGFRGINVDLIYGLPRQTPGGFEKTVESVIELGVDRVAVYSFAFVPWIRAHQKRLGEESLPSREAKFALFALARERFLAAGYEPIGMDHFALPDDELARAKRERKLRRNFQGYTVLPASDVIGFGVSAIGDVKGALVQNRKKLSRYRIDIEAGRLPVKRGRLRTADDEVRRHVIHDFMCNFSVEVPAIEAAHGIEFAQYFADDLERLRVHEREGLVKIGAERLEATAVGELFIRNLALCFDRYWREKHEGSDNPTFSRMV